MNDEALEVLKTILEEVPAQCESQLDEVFKQELPEKAKNAVMGAMRLLEAHKEMMPKDLMPRMAGLLGK